MIVSLLGWLLIALGAIECIYNLTKLHRPIGLADFGVPLFELIILACGVFLLRGHNWARWLAAAWIAFHVVLSFAHNLLQGIIHGAILLVFLWLLFQPEVNAWFRSKRIA
jgi:hypothetical protein